jgi:phosphatidylglycerol lysyltransferase
VLVLHRELSQHTFAELRAAVRSIPRERLLAAGLLTFLSYVVLTGYDALALHTVGISLPYRKTIVASFLGYVFSHNLGLSVLGGSAARFRMYSSSGLSAGDVVKVFAFCALTFWLGLLALSGGVLVVSPELFSRHLPVPPLLARTIGVVLAGATVAYVFACWRRRQPLRWRTWEFPVPRPAHALLQIGLSVVDWIVAGSVLFVLLPPASGLTFFHFLGVFLAAQLFAVTSHVPGGLGVFEGSVLLLLRDGVSSTTILGALLAYRAIYYLAPLGLGVVLLAAHEAARHARHARRLANAIGNAFAEVSPRVVPRLLAFSAFWSGVVLLCSGATPPNGLRFHRLAQLVPPPLLEASHLAGSLAGVGLLVLARGLHGRLRAAWRAAVVLLAVGIAASLLKGLDWEEAGLLAVVFAGLVSCREHFERRASLFSGPPAPAWTAAVAVAVVAAAVLARFSYQHVHFGGGMWWEFTLDAHAPRTLRTTAVAAAAALSFGLVRLIRRAPFEPAPPAAEELEQARRLARASDDSLANLALLGDKSLLWSGDGDGFLMYAVQGGSWMALGDPMGAPDEAKGLVRRFQEVARRHGGRAVLHQVLGDRLALYGGLGFAAHGLGEEARVELARFSLDGRERAELRGVCATLEKSGATFELAAGGGGEPLMSELERVSAEWLARRGEREQGFALGWFSRAVVRRFPVAVVRARGRVAAFASVWLHEVDESAGTTAPAPTREELSIDLLRLADDAPDGAADFLLVRVIELARALGFEWFNLGLAPPAGPLEPALVPLWRQLAAASPGRVESQAPLAELRRRKARFAPAWRARYLAVPSAAPLPAVVEDLVGLIARGPA